MKYSSFVLEIPAADILLAQLDLMAREYKRSCAVPRINKVIIANEISSSIKENPSNFFIVYYLMHDVCHLLMRRSSGKTKRKMSKMCQLLFTLVLKSIYITLIIHE